eukprot:scaffold1.g5607.t1
MRTRSTANFAQQGQPTLSLRSRTARRAERTLTHARADGGSGRRPQWQQSRLDDSSISGSKRRSRAGLKQQREPAIKPSEPAPWWALWRQQAAPEEPAEEEEPPPPRWRLGRPQPGPAASASGGRPSRQPLWRQPGPQAPPPAEPLAPGRRRFLEGSFRMPEMTAKDMMMMGASERGRAAGALKGVTAAAAISGFGSLAEWSVLTGPLTGQAPLVGATLEVTADAVGAASLDTASDLALQAAASLADPGAWRRGRSAWARRSGGGWLRALADALKSALWEHLAEPLGQNTAGAVAHNAVEAAQRAAASALESGLKNTILDAAKSTAE